MNILTIDFEDWFVTSHYRDVAHLSTSKYMLEKPTFDILDSLDQFSVKATFFVLGQVAKDCPKLIEEISHRGHEIASHGFLHKRLEAMKPREFQQELKDSKSLLEDVSQREVVGFRAPFFSLSQQTAWAIDILKEEQFLYDSSVFSMKTTRYGVEEVPERPYYIDSSNIIKPRNKGALIEFPIPIYQIGFMKVPFSGGIYARFMPSIFLKMLLRQTSRAGYSNFYFHPWEIHNKQANLPYPGFLKNIFANYRSETYLRKIESIIQDIKFDTARSYLKNF